MALDNTSTTYTTVSGDTWDLIALKVYGSELKADWLMPWTNPHTPVRFRRGAVNT